VNFERSVLDHVPQRPVEFVMCDREVANQVMATQGWGLMLL
jgi:hypothetical protein